MRTKNPQMIYNGLQTPDGTVIASMHRHDFVAHEDTVTGKLYAVDGGLEYCRYIGDWQDCKRLVYYVDEPYEVVRTFMHWGTMGKNGDEPMHFVAVRNMDIEHIETIFDYKLGPEWAREIFLKEISYRKLIQKGNR